MVYLTDTLKINGHTYKSGAFLLLCWPECVPTFCCIDKVLVIAKRKMFVVDMLEKLEFTVALSSYKVSQINEKKIIPHNELVNRWPLGGYCSDGDIYIVNKYSHFVELI